MAQKLEGILTGIFITSRQDSFVTTRKVNIRVVSNGLNGDKHASWYRGADARAKHYKKGTKIWNNRQISIVSEEELKEIAAAMSTPEIKPEWLGANFCLKGIPALTFLPAGTKIYIPDFYGGQDIGLYVTALNEPCTDPGKIIQANFPDVANLAINFPKAAYNKRGVVAVVEHPGCIQEGSKVTVVVPDQYLY